ncbi:HNH endonuclease signature motif containing protein [Streptomyces sp. BI20]|uniref:HNH endonuclease signature motif containing protein n=1 Tax=Streptomyces sp. BI20 TaxID=3403460 RepID=UPI003C71BBC8
MPETPPHPRRRYTPDRLAEAAAEARNLTEAMEHLGIPDATQGQRRYVTTLMQRHGIDASHFSRDHAKWSRERLAEVAAISMSTAEVVRRLGLDPVGGNVTHIGRRLTKYGVDTSHFSSRPRAHGREKADRRTPGRQLRRRLVALGTPDACALCGIPPTWQGRPLPLEVDHVNGDWRDNAPENLRLLCPNCHSTTDGYRRRKGDRR